MQMVGGNVVADDLPVEGEASSENEDETAAQQSVPGKDDGPVEVPTAQTMQEDIQASIMSGLYVKDGAAYSV